MYARRLLAFGMDSRLFKMALLVAALIVATLTTVALFSSLGTREAEAQTAEPDFDVLVFSKTAGFRHSSIPSGIAAIQQLGTQNNFAVDATEDATQFNDQNLAQYDAVVFLSTTGDVLNEQQQGAFERYVGGGGGYVGIHAAADTEYGWSWYGQLVGGYFKSHPPGTAQASVQVEDNTNPSTSHLPANWVRTDEWYNYQSPTNPSVNGGGADYSPRATGVHVLAKLDENTYDEQDGTAASDDHPIAWCSTFTGGGRSFYTGGGHTEASFAEENFTKHLLGGIRWAGGAADADCGAERENPGTEYPPADSDFQQVTLAKGGDVLGEPVGMTVLPDRRVLTTARDGSIYLVTPDAQTSLAARIPVYSHDEDGLQGVAVDPNFEQNNWVYAFYSPPLNTPAGDAPNDGTGPETFEPYEGHNQVSRFKMTGNTIDLSSEQKLLQVETDRGQCCHGGGEMDFDAEGNLYISTGDDTNPFQSDGYTPIDERPTRNPVFDAQRSSANTNVLSGKLLRIKPDPVNPTYTVPAGNLFDEASDAQNKTRPEIYAMGFRNPYRFDVDPQTGDVLLGDYGPDSGGPSATRGPGGQVEFALVKEPGNYGWPYCTGKNTTAETYNDYNFATGQSGPKFNCQAPVNESPRNTGLTQLPAAKPAWIPYDNCSVPEFGCGSESPMGGPTYRFDAGNPSDTKFPEFYEGKMFLYEWGRGWIKTTNEKADGSPGPIQSFFDSMDLTRPMNLEFGPDGSLYVLDYGGGFFNGDANSALYRIDYVQGQRAPTAEISATPDSGPSPLNVQFSSEGSRDLDTGDSIASYEWDFQNDGTVDSTEENPSFTYSQNGTYTARLTVTDTTGKTGTATETITVGNTRPEISIEKPANGGFFSYRGTIDIKVNVTDPEDGQIDCSRVRVDTALGHNDHTHGDQSFSGCEGSVTVPAPWEDQTQKTFYLVNATYTDSGGPNGGAPLTATTQHVLQPKTVQAEHFTNQEGTTVYDKGTAQGGKGVGSIEDGDYISYGPMNLSNIQSVSYRATSNGQGGIIEMRAGSPTGPLVASTQVNNNGSWDNFAPTQPAPVTDPGGTHEMFFVFKKPAGSASGDALFDLDSMTFTGKGVDSNGPPQINDATATPQRGEAPLAVDFASSVTEPDGEEISYKWDFGVPGTDTDTATTQNATYTYEQAGTYTATFTASDPGGRDDTRTFKINVFAPSSPCLTPESDRFEGATLDRGRWSEIVRENPAGYGVADGALKIDTGNGTDMSGANTNAENLILQPMPGGAWTATTKVTLDFQKTYEQAGLAVYGSDQSFVKLSYIKVPDGRNIEFIQQQNGQPVDGGAQDRTPLLGDEVPSTLFLRITSDGANLRASWSADGQNWTDFGRARPLGDVPNPRVGVAAYNGNGSGNEASFDQFDLATPGDEFDGSGLQKCRWTNVVRENPEGYRVADGALKIDTGDGKDMYGGNTTAENIVTQKAPAGTWQATTKFDLPFTGKDYEQAGLMVYGDDQNFAKLSYIKVPGGRNIEFIQQQNGQPVDGGAEDRTPLLGADVPNSLFLRITSDGTNLRASWSQDGETWTDFGRARPLSAIPNPHVGLAAFNGNGSGNEASFDFFRVDSEIPFSASADADKTSGRAPLTVNFTGSSAGGDGATYAWDFGVPGTDADRANTKDATYTYEQAGTYTATLTATDAAGETAADTVDITVNPPQQPCTTPYTPEPGYKMLFDGTARSLEDWKMSGPGSFEHDGCTIKSVGGLGLFWHTNGGQEFEAPYSLKLEWMKPGDDNSGVFVGFSDPGNDPFNAVREGEEIQIDSTDNPAQTTGAVYLEQAPDAAARDAVLRPDGEWNGYEIRVETDRILVFLNGAKINEWTDDDPNVDLTSGYVGVQNHGSSGPDNPDDVFFRNIRIDDGTTPVDTEAPETTVTSGPSGTTSKTSATFGFSSSEDGSSFECSLDGAPLAACEPPKSFANLSDGRHTFAVRATDAAGNADETPATRRWTVDSTRPTVRALAPRDGSETRDRTPLIEALARDAVTDLSKADLELYVDGKRRTDFSYDRNTDRLRYRAGTLSYGGHTVRVVAEDEAGNRTAEAWRFKVVRR